MLKSLSLSVLVLLSVPLRRVVADSNGMDMSMDGAMDLASGNMLSYLHFTPGDVVWFQGWVPRRVGTIIGACIGLFLLAMFDRWLAACRGLMDAHWRKRAQIVFANKRNTRQPQPPLDACASASSVPSLSRDKPDATGTGSGIPWLENSGARKALPLPLRIAMPFMPTYDIPRGLMHAAQSALEFAFMLIVMTYQAAFIVSIIIGLGVGETLFGRYNAQAHLY